MEKISLESPIPAQEATSTESNHEYVIKKHTHQDEEDFINTFELSPSQKEKLKTYIDDLKKPGTMPIYMQRFDGGELPPEVFESEFIQDMAKQVFYNCIVSNDGAGSGGSWVDFQERFNIEDDFFKQQDFNSYKKKEWLEKISLGYDFTDPDRFKRDIWGNTDPSREQKARKEEDLQLGTLPEVGLLPDMQEVKTVASKGIVTKLFSPNDEQEIDTTIHDYRKYFHLSDEDIKRALQNKFQNGDMGDLEKIDALRKKYSFFEIFLNDPHTKEIAIQQARDYFVRLHEQGAEKLATYFSIQDTEWRDGLSEKQEMYAIEALKKDLKREHGKSFYHLESKAIYISQKQWQIIFEDESLQPQLVEVLGQGLEYDWKVDENLEFIKRIGCPDALMRSAVIQSIGKRLANNSYTEPVVVENFSNKMGISYEEAMEGVVLGILNLIGGQHNIHDIRRVQQTFELSHIERSPEINKSAKKVFLREAAKLHVDNLEILDTLIDIEWAPEDIVDRRTAIRKALTSEYALQSHSAKELRSFIEKYSPDRHSVFLLNDPEIKEVVEQTLFSNIFYNFKENTARWGKEMASFFAIPIDQVAGRIRSAISEGNIIYPITDYTERLFREYLNIDIKAENEQCIKNHGTEILETAFSTKDWTLLQEILKAHNKEAIDKIQEMLQIQEDNLKDESKSPEIRSYALTAIANMPDAMRNPRFQELVSIYATIEPNQLRELFEQKQDAFTTILDIYTNQNINKPKHLNSTIVLKFISTFKNDGTQQEKELFFEKIHEDIRDIAKNEPVDPSIEKDYYRYIVEEVYPKRNYDTYKNMDEYEDRSHDLDKYTFEKNGYEMKLSGVLGYRLKDGAVSNDQIIDEFSNRIDTIKSIATIESLERFLQASITEGKANTTEGMILEYFKQNGYTADTMNVLLAYQLIGQYEDFVSGSADRVSQEENQVSKNYILLDELVNRYGDNMKETIKVIQGAVAIGKDKELFSTSISSKYEARYNELSQLIKTDLERVPREKLTTETIQKKVLKTIKNIFQGVDHIQEKSVYFSSLFSINDMDNLKDVWTKHYNELFAVKNDSAIDMGKTEALQVSIYTKLQNEIGKYEEIKEVDDTKGGGVETKLSKERIIKGYFSKNKENAHARMVGDICLAPDPNMLKNEKYFEFVLFDEDREKCVGTTMLMEMDEDTGEKYLLYCPNPSVGLVSEVSAKKLYKAMTDEIIKFSKENNFDAVLVDSQHGRSTNRAGLFQQSLAQSCLKDASGKELKINLAKEYPLGKGYAYKDNLEIVWKKQ